MADIKGATKLLDAFKKLIQSGKHQEAKDMLTDVKVKIMQFPALPPMLVASATRDKELMLARDMLEHSIFLAVSLKDDTLFTRGYLQLKPYYTDLRAMLPASQHEYPILALNLLRLLTQSRIAEFHVELELLSSEALDSAPVAFARQLEQQLMEGTYEKLYASMESAPSPHMKGFLVMLRDTVRDELAACASAAYNKLLLKDAAAMLKLSTQNELLQFCTDRGWRCDAQYVYFGAEKGKPAEQANMDVFHNMLMYARELDRII